jgi:hypothetical protein
MEWTSRGKLRPHHSYFFDLARTLVFVHFVAFGSNHVFGAEYDFFPRLGGGIGYPKQKGGGYLRTQGEKVKSTLKGYRYPGRIPEMESSSGWFGGACFGLPAKECAGGGHDWMTPGTIRQCKISFCMPLCI